MVLFWGRTPVGGVRSARIPPARWRDGSQRPGFELSAALAACRGAFAGVALFSGMLNVLYLTGSFFMLEVYDRVLPSRSVPTLLGISALALALFGFQGILEVIRSRILVRIGASLDEALSERVYRLSVKLPLQGSEVRGAQPLRDFDQIRSFMSTVGPAAFFDLPWMPLYLGICYVFHPWIGATVTVGGLMLVAVTFLTEVKTRVPAREAARFAFSRNALAEACQRNTEAVHAMGMLDRLALQWNAQNRRYQAAQQRAADVAGGMGAFTKVFRMMLQSGVLGLGAYLVINQQATAGIIIASSILTSRALAPVELVIAHWKGFISARQSWQRLRELLKRVPADKERLELPRPTHALAVDGMSVVVPGTHKAVVQDVNFQLKSGQGLGIIGPSASGKSSLVRAIVGVWPTVRGKVRLDGAALEQWSFEMLGRHMGYLPQDMELFAGSVAENIARFEPEASSEMIIAAAKAAGIHELILNLSDGYETQIGEGGAALSAGQRQRIGLARALFGDPFLVVLDEPNSNLDREGEEALTQAMLGVRARGGIVIVVAHRPSALAGVDNVLIMRGGKQQSFGPKDTVLKQALQPPQAAGPTPLRAMTRPQEVGAGS